MFIKTNVTYKKDLKVRSKQYGSVQLNIRRTDNNDVVVTFTFVRGPTIVSTIIMRDNDVPSLVNILRILLESYTIKAEEQTFVNKIWFDIFIDGLPSIIHVDGLSYENPVEKFFPEYWEYMKYLYKK